LSAGNARSPRGPNPIVEITLLLPPEPDLALKPSTAQVPFSYHGCFCGGAAMRGDDVPAMIRKHRSRISYVHLKGLRREPFAFTPLDEGDLDNSAVIRALAETNYSGWIAVELDAWPDPKAGAERCLAYVKGKIAAA